MTIRVTRRQWDTYYRYLPSHTSLVCKGFRTSTSRGGEDNQESSSTCCKSTFRGKNIMMLGVIAWANWNMVKLHIGACKSAGKTNI